jgi:pyocin large subunit-like protein
VVTRFDRRTKAFIAFERNLIIRTFFKPADGEKYFQRQLRSARRRR